MTDPETAEGKTDPTSWFEGLFTQTDFRLAALAIQIAGNSKPTKRDFESAWEVLWSAKGFQIDKYVEDLEEKGLRYTLQGALSALGWSPSSEYYFKGKMDGLLKNVGGDPKELWQRRHERVFPYRLIRAMRAERDRSRSERSLKGAKSKRSSNKKIKT